MKFPQREFTNYPQIGIADKLKNNADVEALIVSAA